MLHEPPRVLHPSWHFSSYSFSSTNTSFSFFSSFSSSFPTSLIIFIPPSYPSCFCFESLSCSPPQPLLLLLLLQVFHACPLFPHPLLFLTFCPRLPSRLPQETKMNNYFLNWNMLFPLSSRNLVDMQRFGGDVTHAIILHKRLFVCINVAIYNFFHSWNEYHSA